MTAAGDGHPVVSAEIRDPRRDLLARLAACVLACVIYLAVKSACYACWVGRTRCNHNDTAYDLCVWAWPNGARGDRARVPIAASDFRHSMMISTGTCSCGKAQRHVNKFRKALCSPAEYFKYLRTIVPGSTLKAF